jgi:hypothetical protein
MESALASDGDLQVSWCHRSGPRPWVQPQQAEGFAAHPQGCKSFCRCHLNTMKTGCCWRVLTLHQLTLIPDRPAGHAAQVLSDQFSQTLLGA